MLLWGGEDAITGVGVTAIVNEGCAVILIGGSEEAAGVVVITLVEVGAFEDAIGGKVVSLEEEVGDPDVITGGGVGFGTEVPLKGGIVGCV